MCMQCTVSLPWGPLVYSMPTLGPMGPLSPRRLAPYTHQSMEQIYNRITVAETEEKRINTDNTKLASKTVGEWSLFRKILENCQEKITWIYKIELASKAVGYRSLLGKKLENCQEKMTKINKPIHSVYSIQHVRQCKLEDKHVW